MSAGGGRESEGNGNMDDDEEEEAAIREPGLELTVGLYRQISTHIYTQAHTTVHKHTLGSLEKCVHVYETL